MLFGFKYNASPLFSESYEDSATPKKRLEDVLHLAELCIEVLQQNEEHHAEVDTPPSFKTHPFFSDTLLLIYWSRVTAVCQMLVWFRVCLSKSCLHQSENIMFISLLHVHLGKRRFERQLIVGGGGGLYPELLSLAFWFRGGYGSLSFFLAVCFRTKINRKENMHFYVRPEVAEKGI